MVIMIVKISKSSVLLQNITEVLLQNFKFIFHPISKLC